MVFLRDATDEDFDAMVVMYRAVAVLGDTLPSSGEEPHEVIHAEWMGGDRTSVVAVAEGRVVGMYKWGANRTHRAGHIGTATFVVEPGRQGQGIGTRLVAHCLAATRAAGFLGIQFNFVVGTNTRAIAIYERHGLSIVGTLPRAFRHATLGLVDAHVMFLTFDTASKTIGAPA